jgi:putative intracellular protease/amidase
MSSSLRNALAAAAILATLSACHSPPPALDGRLADAQGAIPPYHARLGRTRPLIAIIGDNKGAELTDFVIPYGVLSEAAVADIETVSSQPGPITTFTDMGKPGLRILAQSTMADFESRHPEGADYIVVPALRDTPELIAWLGTEVHKGAILVSVCNGGMVAAKVDAMKGHRATAHWSTEDDRLDHQADVHWVKNRRYVADGNWISSAGVSASIPVSVALVEAISGREHAAAVAARLGIADWSPNHDSDAFQPQLGSTAWPLAKVAYTNSWFHGDDAYGVAATPGIDEIALALTIDAFSSTGRSQAYLVAPSGAPLTTRRGLTLLPDRIAGAADAPRDMLAMPQGEPAKALDEALAGVARRYGRETAYGVALVLEYPGFKE